MSKLKLTSFLDCLSLKTITEALTVNKVIRKLDTSRSRVGMNGALALAHLVSKNKYLRELTLDQCSIGATGCEYISGALKTNVSLKFLSMNNNCIGKCGAMFLGEALKVNRGLKYLHVDSNEIERVGSNSLAQGIAVNSSLEEVGLRYNIFSDEGEANLVDAANKSVSLRILNLYGDNTIAHKNITIKSEPSSPTNEMESPSGQNISDLVTESVSTIASTMTMTSVVIPQIEAGKVTETEISRVAEVPKEEKKAKFIFSRSSSATYGNLTRIAKGRSEKTMGEKRKLLPHGKQ